MSAADWEPLRLWAPIVLSSISIGISLWALARTRKNSKWNETRKYLIGVLELAAAVEDASRPVELQAAVVRRSFIDHNPRENLEPCIVNFRSALQALTNALRSSVAHLGSERASALQKRLDDLMATAPDDRGRAKVYSSREVGGDPIRTRAIEMRQAVQTAIDALGMTGT